MPVTQKRSKHKAYRGVRTLCPDPPPTSFLFDELHCVMFFADGNQSVDWDYRSGELAGCQKTGECVDSSATKTHSVPRQRRHRSLPAEWSRRESHGATLRSSTALHSGTQHLRGSKQVWRAVQFSSVQFKMVSTCSEKPIHALRLSQKLPRCYYYLWNSSDNYSFRWRWDFLVFQVRSSSASSFCTSLLQET